MKCAQTVIYVAETLQIWGSQNPQQIQIVADLAVEKLRTPSRIGNCGF